MLPDYPECKEKLRKLLMRAASKGPNRGFLSQIPKRHFFEGNRMGIAREDGTVDESKFITVTSELNLKVKDLENASTSDIAHHLQKQADEMHLKQSRMMYEKIDQVVSSVGNALDLAGKPLTPEAFLQLFERIQTEFDDEGNPYMPSIVGGKEVLEIFKRVMGQIEADPNLGKKMKELMIKKRSDWRDRESRRKLVG